MTIEPRHEIKDVWDGGSYSRFADNYLPMAAELVKETQVKPGDHVLDVACGTGNVAITAARRGATVKAIDITPSMLERARTNAETAGVQETEFRRADAAELPYPDDAFDVTLSALGHMYAEPPSRAARELIRVTRPGGKIGFTSWTPTSVFPVMAAHVVPYLAPEDRPGFTEPPFMWGDRDTVEDRLGEQTDNQSFETGVIDYPALSPSHFWREFASNSGVFREFLGRVSDTTALRRDVTEAIQPFFDDDTNSVELEYLLTTATVAGTE